MALEAGSSRDGTGLAAALADAMKESSDEFDLEIAYKNIDAIAQAIVDYFVANAEVEVPSAASGSDTLSGTIG